MSPAVRAWGAAVRAGLRLVLLLLLLVPHGPAPAAAAPGLCVGPVCGDEISRSAKHHWQLRLRVSDQESRRERIVVDCRDGAISPRLGPVDRAYSAAVARRCCRLVGEG